LDIASRIGFRPTAHARQTSSRPLGAWVLRGETWYNREMTWATDGLLAEADERPATGRHRPPASEYDGGRPDARQ
jgi:hypothetical protein